MDAARPRTATEEGNSLTLEPALELAGGARAPRGAGQNSRNDNLVLHSRVGDAYESGA